VKISTFPTDAAAAAALAEQVVTALRAKPRLVLGLPAGRTPLGLYRELAARAARGEADFSLATSFNLDEFVGIPASHPGSYRTFMQEHLFRHVNQAPERMHLPDGMAPDLEAECARYEAAIAAAGGIDLQILGIGTNGHVGFNEPGPSLQPLTHRVVLRPETRRANAALFGGEADQVPREALSMGMATILHARRIVLLATGASKASCIERAVNGPLTTEVPASFLLVHPEVELMLDDAAAARLTG
jgi:glucosamine-6-phosphate deaminase